MAIAEVRSTSASIKAAGQTLYVKFASAMGAGNTFIVLVVADAQPTSYGFCNSAGNAYSGDTSGISLDTYMGISGNIWFGIYSARNPPSGYEYGLAFEPGGTARAAILVEYSGVATSSYLGNTSAWTGSNGTYGTTTPIQGYAGQLGIAGGGWERDTGDSISVYAATNYELTGGVFGQVGTTGSGATSNVVMNAVRELMAADGTRDPEMVDNTNAGDWGVAIAFYNAAVAAERVPRREQQYPQLLAG